MVRGMEIVSYEQIAESVNIVGVIGAVKNGFIDHYRGNINGPSPMQFLFHDGPLLQGDCHVKGAQGEDEPYFVVKVASGFYRNEEVGLPVNNGLVLLLSSKTGQPVALLQDNGLLTACRTAAAGALAAELCIGPNNDTLGIVGTGQQAELQALWISKYLDIKKVCLFGRSSEKAQDLSGRVAALGINCEVVESVKELGKVCRTIVTTTPATSPIIQSNDISPGTHIVAVGADSPGKQELDSEILAQATTIITDDHEQCLAHGEFGAACREGIVSQTSDIAFGSVLAGDIPCEISAREISVVDLTGLGAQDMAIASYIYGVHKAKGKR